MKRLRRPLPIRVQDIVIRKGGRVTRKDELQPLKVQRHRPRSSPIHTSKQKRLTSRSHHSTRIHKCLNFLQHVSVTWNIYINTTVYYSYSKGTRKMGFFCFSFARKSTIAVNIAKVHLRKKMAIAKEGRFSLRKKNQFLSL